ncbi:MAG: DNA polymerase I [Syntrophobacteraceae bacterium]|nr:DNA polymerase I [Syntrophobacteraceae bacterium]
MSEQNESKGEGRKTAGVGEAIPAGGSTAGPAAGKTFFIIDGSSYIYRAFYAIRRLANSRGMAIQAVHGFLTMLLKVMREKKPDYICVVFDAPGRNFRHELSEAYKATRQSMPEELIPQIPYIKNVVQYLGVSRMEMEGFEADDLIATLTRWASERGLKIELVSGDKDLHQLIRDPDVNQWDPQNDRVFDEKAVFERFGVAPAQIVDYLALVGDTTDNVCGVKGVGAKGASQLLQKWGSLEGIYDHLDEIAPASLRQKLSAGRQDAWRSRELVSLRFDAIEIGALEEFAPSAPMRQEMYNLCEELELKTILDMLKREWQDEFAKPEGSGLPGREISARVVRSREELAGIVETASTKPLIAMQVETDSREAMDADIVSIALCWQEGEAWYIPVGHSGECGEQMKPAEALQALAPLLGGRKVPIAGHDLKFQIMVLKRYGMEPGAVAFDTMMASYLLNPGEQIHALDRVCAEHLAESVCSMGDITGKGRSHTSFSEIEFEKAVDFTCRQVEVCFRLVPVLRRKLEEGGLIGLYESIELPLVEVLARMEHTGILVDKEKLENLSVEFSKALDQRAELIYREAREEFNIQSPKQLGVILFEKMGIAVKKKTKSGPSTDTSVLEELALEHPIAELVLGYRTLAKLKGTYADALPRLVRPETGRIHTSFNQAVTATGRLSSSNPNLQNIPIRSYEGRRIREAFIAAPGNLLMSADYSQIELRVLAHYSRDESLTDSFNNDEDVHRRTASEIFGVDLSDVTSEMRRQAKMINFGIAYGMSPFGLAQRLGISTRMAKTDIDRYFERYSGVRRFIGEAVQSARDLGYAETLLGRRRAIPELRSKNFSIRQLGERLAINTPIQGTAADLIKKAMVDINAALGKKSSGVLMLLQVHDELLFELPHDKRTVVENLVRRAMEDVHPLDVVLKVEIGWGVNWTQAHA